MADIAMLVAEEYERRVRKNGGDVEGINLFSCVSLLAQNFDGSSWMKKNFGEEKMNMVKRALEPKSLVGFAVINGSSA